MDVAREFVLKTSMDVYSAMDDHKAINALTKLELQGCRIVSIRELRTINSGYIHKHIEWHEEYSFSIWGIFSNVEEVVCLYIQDSKGKIKYYA